MFDLTNLVIVTVLVGSVGLNVYLYNKMSPSDASVLQDTVSKAVYSALETLKKKD